MGTPVRQADATSTLTWLLHKSKRCSVVTSDEPRIPCTTSTHGIGAVLAGTDDACSVNRRRCYLHNELHADVADVVVVQCELVQL